MYEEYDGFFNDIMTYQYLNDNEVNGVPLFQQIVDMENYNLVSAPQFDESKCKQILKKLDEGEYKVVDRYGDFNSGSQESADSEILTAINEQRYSISYRSPFEYIHITENKKERHVDKNQEYPNSTKTITEAIALSLPGETIIIHSGDYEESIILDRSVELKAGENQIVTVMSSSSDVIALNANCGKITGIRIVCRAPGDAYCARAIIGILELVNCRIEASCAGAVRTESEAKIQAESCTFVSTTSGMTSLMESSHSFFNKCSFTYEQAGEEKKRSRQNCIIAIGEQSTAIFNECTITNSSVWFRSNSYGMIRNSRVSSSYKYTINISNGAQPLILKSHIVQCADVGIVIGIGAKAVIQECTVSDCRLAAIMAQGAHDFVILNSEISNNLNGFRVCKGSHGSIVGTRFVANKNNGIQIEDCCNVIIRKSVFLENAKAGIVAAHNLATSPNEFTSIEIISTQISRCQIGISLSQGTTCKITRCEFRDCAIPPKGKVAACLHIMATCLALLSETTFDCPSECIQLCCASQGRVKANGCTFSNSLRNSCHLESADVGFHNCTFTKNIIGVKSMGSSSVTFYSCSFKENTIAVQVIDTSNSIFEESRFEKNRDYSIHAKAQSHVTISSDTSIKGGAVGMDVSESAAVDIKNSRFEEQQSVGLLLNGPNIKVSLFETRMAGAGMNCIHARGVSREGALSVNKCLIECKSTSNVKQSEIGIKLDQESFGLIKETRFISLNEGGIVVQSRSSTNIENCMFIAPGRVGVLVDDQSFANVQGCHFSTGLNRAGLAKGHSKARFYNCLVEVMKSEPPFLAIEDSTIEEAGITRAT